MKKLLIPIVIFLLLAVPVFAPNNVEVYLFTAPGCPHCANIHNFLADMQEKYPTLIVHEVQVSDDIELFKTMLQAYEVPFEEWSLVPRTFISDKTFLGDMPFINAFEENMQYCLENKCELLYEPLVQQELHLGKLVALAATDAVSPCELAVLTMLLTAIMIRNPERKTKILFAGLAFALAVFIAYFAFGSLIIFGFKSVISITDFSTSLLHTVLAGFAIILGLANLKDFIWPDAPLVEVPLAWRPRMKSLIAKTASVGGAFVVGLLVSFFLTPCSIGPYFVAGGLLAEMNWTVALPLLFMYNLIFIAPMVAMIFIIYFGISTIEKTSRWRKAAWRYLHLAIALIMFGLGGAMLMGWV